MASEQASGPSRRMRKQSVMDGVMAAVSNVSRRAGQPRTGVGSHVLRSSEESMLSLQSFTEADQAERNFVCEKITARASDAVICVAFSSSGHLLLAGAVNRSIYIFDTMTGEEVVRFKASASVTSIAFLEPNHVFSESHDFMDANSEGWCLAGSFAGHADVFAVNRHVLDRIASSTKEVKEKAQAVAVAETAVAIASSGKNPDAEQKARDSLAAAQKEHGAAAKAEEKACGPMYTRKFDHGDIVSMGVGAHGTRVALGFQQGVVIKYRFEPPVLSFDAEHPPLATCLEPLLTLKVMSVPSLNLALALDASADLLVTGGEDKAVKLWSLRESAPPPPGYPPALGSDPLEVDNTKRRLIECFNCDGAVYSIALDAAGTTLAVGVSSHTEVYRLAWRAEPDRLPLIGPTGLPGVMHEPLLFFEDAEALQGGVALSSSGATLAVGGKYLVQVIDVHSGASIRRLPQDGRVRCVAVSRNGDMVANGGFDKKASMLRIDHGTRLLTCSPRQPRRKEPNAPMRAASSEKMTPSRREPSHHRGHSQPGKEVARHQGTDATRPKAGRKASLIVMNMPKEDTSANAFARSVHTVTGASIVVVGMDEGKNGSIRLYETNENKGADTAELLHTWKMEKPIWCVRLSHDARLVFGAGYDGRVTLFDVFSKARLTSISHSSTTGPAFIWSMSLSANSRFLAVGCWNFFAHFYHINMPRLHWRMAVEKLRKQRGDPPLRIELYEKQTLQQWGHAVGQALDPNGSFVQRRRGWIHEVTTVGRNDRVYSVALSQTGSHLAIGGRDKTVSLYDMRLRMPGRRSAADKSVGATPAVGPLVSWRSVLSENPSSSPSSSQSAVTSEPVNLWVQTTEDYIYTVALSSNMQYCVHGGPEMIVHVRDGRLGHALWSVPCPGTVWSLAISDDAADAPKLVVAGDFHGVSVYDLKTHRCELRLLQQKTVQGTAITKDSICYTSGSFTHVYGQGGTHYSWRERPSFAHILRTMAISTDDQRAFPRGHARAAPRARKRARPRHR